MTMNKIFRKLRNHNSGQYRLLAFCIFLSVFLISSFSFMYFGPTVQEFLPKGGDTRKMAGLLLGVTAVGCSIFTVYASTLFFRSKSREYGIFLALGEPKRELKRILFTELVFLTASASFIGIILGIPASWLIWKHFETFLISTDVTAYRFGISGFFAGLLFALVLSVILGILGRRFISKTDLMDILKASQKTEMVKTIKPWTLPVGIILMILGVSLGLGLNAASVRLLNRSIPGTSAFYLLALIGIYLVLLNVVSQCRLKKNKTKFYKNMVSVSLMRFSAKSTTRNMCVIVLLLFSCMFSAFYGLLYNNSATSGNDEASRAFAIHAPAMETQITKEEIEAAAKEHSVTITDPVQAQASDLVISYKKKDYDDGRYFDVNAEESKLALFFSNETYHVLTGQNANVTAGSYKTITPDDYKENIWDYMDGLYEITNPDTGEKQSLHFSGSLEYSSLYAMSSPYAYVLSDKDYASITKGLSEKYKEHITLFHVKDYETSYAFAKDLSEQYIEHATELSAHIAGYDSWEESIATKKGDTYYYAGSPDFSANSAILLDNWKYAPYFPIITEQDYMQLICIYIMLCLYIFIITLSAVAIINYVRSISIAQNNITLFQNLNKLGADKASRREILKKQLSKIFKIPAILGCSLGLFFTAGVCWTNDGRFTVDEINTFMIMTELSGFIWLFLYIVYRISKNAAERIIDIP